MLEHDDYLRGLSIEGMESDRAARAAAKLFSRLLLQVDEIERANLSILENEESWGLLHRMYEKAAAHTGASIVLLSNGHFAAAEVLCRTAIEAAINLYYCSPNDSVERILTYFKSHIAEERRQNRLWSESLKDAPMPKIDRAEHERRIRDKGHSLSTYERIITEAFAQTNRNYSTAGDKWPSTFERFKTLGKELDYRTLYTALCSQTHNDAEELITEFVHLVSQAPGAPEAQREENQNFARVMVLAALCLLTEAASIYLAKYPIDSNEPMLSLLKEAMAQASDLASVQLGSAG